MKAIPPEIDSLIWRVADRADASAVTEFSNRYPAYRSVLMRRIAMVKALRDSNAPRPTVVPAFVYPTGIARTWPRWSLFGVALAVAGTMSYVLTLRATQTSEQGSASKLSSASPREGRPGRSIRVDDDLRMGDLVWRSANKSAPAMPAKPIEVPKPVFESKPSREDMTPFSLHVENASLQTVIKTVAASGKLTVEFGPGMHDTEIGVEYEGQPASAVLNDLGRTYNFTVFDEGGGKLLVVPEVDHATGKGGYLRDSTIAPTP